jgi:hypothetical protein
MEKRIRERGNNIKGFHPFPHFILFLDKKNEARKIKTKRPPTHSAARQEFLIK